MSLNITVYEDGSTYIHNHTEHTLDIRYTRIGHPDKVRHLVLAVDQSIAVNEPEPVLAARIDRLEHDIDTIQTAFNRLSKRLDTHTADGTHPIRRLQDLVEHHYDDRIR